MVGFLYWYYDLKRMSLFIIFNITVAIIIITIIHYVFIHIK